MTETTRDKLRALLEESYATFRERLRRRLGSEDLADEALQNTWLRLARNDDMGAVRSPDTYLFRVALNVAADLRAEARRLSRTEVNAIIHMADAVLDPEEIVAARAELTALERAISELSPRRRSIFILARVDGIAHDEIARRFGISPRMVEKELRRALDHCSERLNRKLVRRFGPGPREQS
ncbi:MAG: RNA polymerase sigma factor [Pseudomonadota bacterium]